jgi:endonuclease/exonuclease/phosphatase family metal-dependent hydrolase
VTRLLTYNVHRCVGTDGKLDVGRVAEVIAAQRPDIVCLQEVDVGRARTGGVDQAESLARRLGMAFHFNAALKVEAELYGDAILTGLPVRLVKSGPLPGLPGLRGLEPRGALWVAVTVGGAQVQIINTHLGLVPREQRAQAEALVGPGWLGSAPPGEPLALVGDFNATRLSRAYQILASALRDARRAAPFARAGPTFPSGMPILAIDHVFVGAGLDIMAVRTPLDPLSRRASDHLPLAVDFRVVARASEKVLAPPAEGPITERPRDPRRR